MNNEKFKQIETLLELDARHDAILYRLEELDKEILDAIKAAQDPIRQPETHLSAVSVGGNAPSTLNT